MFSFVFVGEGKGNPFQYSCLENPMDRGAWCPWGRKESNMTEQLHSEGISSRISEAEEQISELEDKMVEITSEEQNKVKRMKRTEGSLRDLWDNIKCTNI